MSLMRPQVGAALDEALDDEAVYVLHRTFDDTAQGGGGGRAGGRADPKQLYVEGLKVRVLNWNVLCCVALNHLVCCGVWC